MPQPVLGAAAISQALKGRRTGRGGVACCPAHQDRRPSLALHEAKDGKVLLRCHAGWNYGDSLLNALI